MECMVEDCHRPEDAMTADEVEGLAYESNDKENEDDLSDDIKVADNSLP